MVNRLTKIIIIALILVRAMLAYNNEINKRIITAEEIDNYGITRISDLFYLIDEWQVSSVDGFSSYISASGWNTFGNQDWIVLINNSEVDVKLFELNHINLIPLSVDDIERIEIITSPAVLNGVYVKRGAINFITKDAVKPISVSFTVETGNETGDPGPYKYTGDQSPNVDQIGPNYSARLAGKLGKFYYSFSSKYHINTSTDPRIEFRNSNYPWALKQTRQFSYSSEFAFKDKNQRHSISFRKSKIGKPLIFSDVGADLLYLNSLGREFHSDNEFNLLNLKGEFSVSQYLTVGYNGSISSKSVRPIADSTYQMDLIQDNYDGNIFLSYQTNNFLLSGGYSHSKKDYFSSQIVDAILIDKDKFYLESGYRFSSNFIAGILLELQNNYSSSTLSMNFTIDYAAGENNKFRFSIGKNEVGDDERNDVFYLSSLGMNSFGFEFKENIYRNITKDKVQFVEFHWLNSGELYQLKNSISYKSFSNYPVVTYKYNRQNINSLKSYNRVLAGGSLFTLSSRFNKTFSEIYSLNVQYTFTTSFDKKNLLWNEFVSLPNHILSLTSNVKFYESFVFWWKFKYQSETEWKNIIISNVELNNVYSNHFKELFLLDCGIRKSLAEGKIVVNLNVKNILADIERSHPFGAINNTRIALVLGVKL